MFSLASCVDEAYNETYAKAANGPLRIPHTGSSPQHVCRICEGARVGLGFLILRGRNGLHNLAEGAIRPYREATWATNKST